MNKNFQNITKPRDATSVIIIKRDNFNCYVLMGRRPKSSKFMPGVYVFPGGAVDKDDYICGDFLEIEEKTSRKKLKTRSFRQTKALLLSAIRETAEETGLFLGKNNKSLSLIKLKNNNLWYSFFKKALLPDLDGLYFFGRAITPSFLKTRYHARFFLASYDNFTGKIKSNGELEDIKWINLKDFSELPMADVTAFILKQINIIEGKVEKIDKNYLYPMFTWKNKKKWIKWEKFYD